jgi:hypothetical protein
VFQAERDSERFALYARKAALDERAEEIRQQLKVCGLYRLKPHMQVDLTLFTKADSCVPFIPGSCAFGLWLLCKTSFPLVFPGPCDTP